MNLLLLLFIIFLLDLPFSNDNISHPPLGLLSKTLRIFLSSPLASRATHPTVICEMAPYLTWFDVSNEFSKKSTCLMCALVYTLLSSI